MVASTSMPATRVFVGLPARPIGAAAPDTARRRVVRTSDRRRRLVMARDLHGVGWAGQPGRWDCRHCEPRLARNPRLQPASKLNKRALPNTNIGRCIRADSTSVKPFALVGCHVHRFARVGSRSASSIVSAVTCYGERRHGRRCQRSEFMRLTQDFFAASLFCLHHPNRASARRPTAPVPVHAPLSKARCRALPGHRRYRSRVGSAASRTQSNSRSRYHDGTAGSHSRAAAVERYAATRRSGFMPRVTTSRSQRGFAVASTDGGHKGEVFDFSFFADQNAALNFFYRANNKVTQVAKAVIAVYYGRGPRIVLLRGSTGGREGMMMSQRFPDYFDGIVAGAPAMRTSYSAIGDRHVFVQLNAIAPRDERASRSRRVPCRMATGARDQVVARSVRCAGWRRGRHDLRRRALRLRPRIAHLQGAQD